MGIKELNPSRPHDAYLCQTNRSSFVHITTCHLSEAKPLSEPMLMFIVNPVGMNCGEYKQFSHKKINFKNAASGQFAIFNLGVLRLGRTFTAPCRMLAS